MVYMNKAELMMETISFNTHGKEEIESFNKGLKKQEHSQLLEWLTFL